MKALKIIHTADWHLGQMFFEYDRTFEHHQFLNWLLGVLKDKDVDVLLICGDVFDVSNPSAASLRLFYDFLRKASQLNGHLQIVVIAGNHDSPSRIEMPKPLLEAFNIHVVGNIDYVDGYNIDFNKLVIPLYDRERNIKAQCMALPFIRMCDFPPATATKSLAEQICYIYNSVYEFANSKCSENQAVIATGHLHTINAEISEGDKSERILLGGQEFVPFSAFHENIAYVALGHIHKAQKTGGKETVRYSGSPLPMSFSEINYKHQVVYFEIEEKKCSLVEILEVPKSVELLRVPSKHAVLFEVLEELRKLPVKNSTDPHAPYLEVRVLLKGPEPKLRYEIECAIENKQVRLAKIDVKYHKDDYEEEESPTFEKLHELQPSTVFQKIYQKKFQQEVPETLMDIFNKVVAKSQREQA